MENLPFIKNFSFIFLSIIYLKKIHKTRVNFTSTFWFAAMFTEDLKNMVFFEFRLTWISKI